MIKWFKRVGRKFSNAFKGLWVIISEEKSLWVHFFATFIVIIAGIIFKLDAIEWALIVFAVGIVIGFEIMNTAIEYLVDIFSFEYNIKAKKIKDVAAMATLFVTIIAIVIGLLIFVPEFKEFIN